MVTMAHFLQWASKHNKEYKTQDEIELRLNNFAENLAKIEALNAQNLTWKAGLNEYSDLSEEEFGKQMTIQFPPSTRKIRVKDSGPRPNDDPIDWRTKGAVGPVHNQGSSGAVSSFVAADSVAGWNVIFNTTKPTYVDLSWDQITAHIGGNNWPAKGIQYAAVGGLCTQAGYVQDRTNCKRVAQPNRVAISEDEDELYDFLKKVPSTFAIQAATAFQHYSSGIFTGPCDKQWNHALLLVGSTTDYWISKNSWGTSWGEQGYIRIQRGKDVCGLSFEEAIPV